LTVDRGAVAAWQLIREIDEAVGGH
jgi:hypothetical protein